MNPDPFRRDDVSRRDLIQEAPLKYPLRPRLAYKLPRLIASMRALISRLRYTARLLLKSPAFTIAIVLILGFGIGSNTAIFSLVNGVLLKPLPYPNPDRLVSIYQVIRNNNKAEPNYADYVDFSNDQSRFDDLAAYYTESHSIICRIFPMSLSELLFSFLSSQIGQSCDLPEMGFWNVQSLRGVPGWEWPR